MILIDLYHIIDKAFEFLLWPLVILTKIIYKTPATIVWFLAGTYVAHLLYAPVQMDLQLFICFTTWVLTGVIFGYWVACDREDSTILKILSVFFSGFVLYLPLSWVLNALNLWLTR